MSHRPVNPRRLSIDVSLDWLMWASGLVTGLFVGYALASVQW